MLIAEMTMEEIEARKLEIAPELSEASEERLMELKTEVEELNARAQELKDAEERAAQAKALNNHEIEPEKIIEESIEEERKMFDIASKEYRDAFMAMLMGRETEEQRAIFADNTNYGDGVALPVAIDSAIWDQVTTAHPILNDINVVKSGMVMKVTKSTPAAVTGKKDSAASAEQTFTNVDVVLAGKDYHTYVCLSFAEAKMSQGAMEQYLVKEIADAIGEAVAKDVFARILTDVGTAAATKSSSNTYFACVNAALGAATQAVNAVIYAPANLYYAMQAEVDANGQPILRDGVAFGRTVKIDNAATKITIVDPDMFLLNVVQDTMIDSAKDLKAAQIVVGGYMRAEGCLRKVKAAQYVG